jgi:CheY-like chemotaxis protein
VRVLVVDDEADARELITTVLEDHGADVRVAASAKDAMETLSQLKPHVLLSDIGMPREDGYSLIRRVRALSPDQGGAVPAVALTAYAEADVGERVLAAGFHVHLAKPVEPVKLATLIAQLAGRAGPT